MAFSTGGLTSSSRYGIEILGLNEFTRALKQAGNDFPKKLAEANSRAAKTVVASSRQIAGGVSRQAAKAAKSLRASRSGAYAAVTGGGARYPFFYGAEFGALRYKQFMAWRGSNKVTTWEGGPGYFLHPGIRRAGPFVTKNYQKTLDEIMGTAFPE